MVVASMGWVEFSNNNAAWIVVGHLVTHLRWDWFLVERGWFWGILVVFPIPPAIEGVDEENSVEDGNEGDVFMPVESDSDNVENNP